MLWLGRCFVKAIYGIGYAGGDNCLCFKNDLDKHCHIKPKKRRRSFTIVTHRMTHSTRKHLLPQQSNDGLGARMIPLTSEMWRRHRSPPDA